MAQWTNNTQIWAGCTWELVGRRGRLSASDVSGAPFLLLDCGQETPLGSSPDLELGAGEAQRMYACASCSARPWINLAHHFQEATVSHLRASSWPPGSHGDLAFSPVRVGCPGRLSISQSSQIRIHTLILSAPSLPGVGETCAPLCSRHPGHAFRECIVSKLSSYQPPHSPPPPWWGGGVLPWHHMGSVGLVSGHFCNIKHVT